MNVLRCISGRGFVALTMLVFASGLSVVDAQTEDTDTSEVVLPFPFGTEDPFNPTESPAGFDFNWPDNFQFGTTYDQNTGLYILSQTIGDTLEYRPSTYFTLEEFLNFDMEGNLSEYWDELQQEEDEAERAFAPKLTIENELFETIFGSNEIEIKPQGSAELTFGVNVSNTENPQIPERQRRITTFDFDQQIQLNIGGASATKLSWERSTTPRHCLILRTK